MNETIKAIWNKAASSHVQAETSWQTKENFMSRFAELIVEECMQVSLKHSHRDDDMGAIIARNIKQHFGLEK